MGWSAAFIPCRSLSTSFSGLTQPLRSAPTRTAGTVSQPVASLEVFPGHGAAFPEIRFESVARGAQRTFSAANHSSQIHFEV